MQKMMNMNKNTKKINKRIMTKMTMKKIKKTKRVLNIFPAGKLFNMYFLEYQKEIKRIVLKL